MKTKSLADADLYIQRVTDLPPAPTVATELLGLFGDPDTDIVRVVETIRHDPSLTAKLLKMCNSAYFAGAEPASDMFEVVTRLGFYEVYRAVSALVAANAMSLAKTGDGLDVNHLWRHSVTTAVAAGKLAQRVGEPEPSAFTAGLLHDLGKLVFASVEGPRYGALIKLAEASGDPTSEVEQAALGVDHAVIGAKLLARWGLPDKISLAVGFHNGFNGSDQPPEPLAAIVQIASILALELEAEDTAARNLSVVGAEAMALLELTADDLPALKAEIKDGLEKVEGLSAVCFDAAI